MQVLRIGTIREGGRRCGRQMLDHKGTALTASVIALVLFASCPEQAEDESAMGCTSHRYYY